MDVDEVLPALPTGPRGVAGGLLQRLEQEALAEQAALEAAARGEKPASAAASTSNGAADDRPTYVPGQKRSVNPVEATSASTARDPAAGPSTAPESSGSKEHNQNATSNNATSSSTRLPSPSEPPVKKARVQPTIRMQFTFPPYPPGKDPIAKHVPIFNVRDLAESKGLLLPSEDVLMDEGSSSGGSDDEGGDEEGSGNDNEGGETSAVSEAYRETYLQPRILMANLLSNLVLSFVLFYLHLHSQMQNRKKTKQMLNANFEKQLRWHAGQRSQFSPRNEC